ncbi:MAG: hypothetical protein ACRD6W_10735, partial [Nitrososphaerales archaeon]
PTVIKYVNLGAGTVMLPGPVITLMGSPPNVAKAGSFVVPNPPNMVRLDTSNLACAVSTRSGHFNPPHTRFSIMGGTINV